MPRIMSTLLSIAAVLGILVMALTPAQAAPVFSQGVITGESDILNGGTVIAANTLGATSSATTVNGIAFGTSILGVSGMAISGSDLSNQFPGGSPLDQLLSGAMFQTGGFSSLTFNGLSAGTDYLMQIFVSNTLNSTGKTSRITFQGVQYNLINFANDPHYIRISFTALGVSETFLFGNGSGAESNRFLLNGYALTTASVPAPGALLLLGLGFAGLGAARRRRN